MVRASLVITDLTRMQEGHVCVAGYRVEGDASTRCVRPEFRFGSLTEVWLGAGGEVVVRPFAVVELDLKAPRPDPPHTEDWIVDERYRVRRGMLSPEERLALLAELDDASVDRIFGAPVHEEHGWFVLAGEGTRSLGTVRPEGVTAVAYAPKPQPGKWHYRLGFGDANGRVYNLAVTDLAYRYFLDSLRDGGLTPPQVQRRVLGMLRDAEHLYLRVGLARGWNDGGGRRCHLQITGVYGFPDYLDGRCFADFPQSALAPIDLSEVPF